MISRKASYLNVSPTNTQPHQAPIPFIELEGMQAANVNKYIW